MDASAEESGNEDVRTRSQRRRTFVTRCCALFPARTSNDAHDADAALEEERVRRFDALLHEFMHDNDSPLFDLRTHPVNISRPLNPFAVLHNQFEA